jgi:outer membrane lipoprotein-sorting protein
MQLQKGRGPLWIVTGIFLVSIVVFATWQVLQRGTPQERLVSEITRELARVATVQGRLQVSFEGATLDQELWVQRPGFMRTETEAGPSAFAGTIVVLNDQEGWVFNPSLNMATVVDRAAYQDAIAGDTGAGSLIERMPDTVLATLQNETQINVGARTEVAGRAATLVEIVVPENEPSLPPGILQVWLDDQYSYPLAWRDSSGRELRFSSVVFNEEIDPATFVFFPPPGATVRRIDPNQ